MRVRMLVFALCVFAGIPGAAQPVNREGGESVSKFDPGRDAAADIRAAVAKAGVSHKRILLDVGGEWCIWCRRLDTLFATHANLAQFMHNHYEIVKVNYSKENKNEAVLSKYPKIPGYPHLFVLESDGTLLQSQDTGELESGNGHDPAKVMSFLKKWAGK